MNTTPENFLKLLLSGKTEKELNKKEDDFIDDKKYKKLIRKYGHTPEEAKEHLLTDYSDGFTICAKCGSYYHLGNGFTKHLSDGCLHCEGEAKHNVYFHKGNNKRHYKSEPRYMSQMFDDGMHYCKDKLQIELFNKEIAPLQTA